MSAGALAGRKISIVVQLSYLGQQLPAGGGSGGDDDDDGRGEGPEATVCDVNGCLRLSAGRR